MAGASAYRSGTSVVAAAAYRGGDRLEDQRYQKTHDYTRKQNVLHSAIIAPDHAPDWMYDREKLWNGVEAGEKRKDAQLAKEAVIVLPRNLSQKQHIEVVEGWVKDNLTSRSLVADYAIHSPDASDGGKNPHAHVMFTLRPVEQDGKFGKKLTGYKNGGLDGKEFLTECRFSYQDHLNRASSSNDNEQIVFDLRSYRDKGVDKIPQPKRGPKVTYLQMRGYDTEWNKEIEKVKQINQAKQGHRQYVRTHTINRYNSTMEAVRQDMASRYYDIMYGDGREGSYWYHYERDDHDYGR